MSVELDEGFVVALRATLVERANTEGKSRPRRPGWRVAGWTLVSLAVLGGGTAVATEVLTSAPGGDVVSELAAPVTVTGDGTQTVPLGPPPARANRIELRLTCLTAGQVTFADGARVVCGGGDVGTRGAVTEYSLPLRPGQHATTITADPGTRWRLVARYTHVTTSAWGVNSHGQTYGVANDNGTPDLILVVATNGKTGYAYATQLAQAEGPDPTSPQQAAAEQRRQRAVAIPVYTSDGHTVIGQFVVGNGPASHTGAKSG